MHHRAARALVVVSLWLLTSAFSNTPQVDAPAIVHALDAENQSRFEHVLGFSDVEHYAVFRGKDEATPAAEMTVKVTYRKGVGKTYKVLSQSGSSLVIRYGLRPLLDNEKAINDPATVSRSWFTSANYEMALKAGDTRTIDGRPCLAIAIKPRHSAPNMIDGMLWVDQRDYSLVEVEGIASKSPSIFAGTTHMMRRYANMQGYAMATHARAESSSLIFGRTVVTIDYSDYHFQLRPKS